MMLKVFTVYDLKAEAYLRPFYFQSTGEALRAFTDTANDPNTGIGKHPEDYQLFEIGTFDEQSGLFDCDPAKRVSLGNAIEFTTPLERAINAPVAIDDEAYHKSNTGG